MFLKRDEQPSYEFRGLKKSSEYLRVLKVGLFCLVAATLPIHASAATISGPQTITLDGKLTDVSGTNALLDSSVVIDVKIMNPSGTCMLYEEHQTIDTTASEGRFTVLVGSVTGASKRVTGAGGDPGNPMVTIFNNQNAIAGSSCTYTPVAGDTRLIRVTVSPSSTGTVEQLSPDTVVDSVPFALMAESLQGLDRDHVLAIDPTSTTFNQTTVSNIFSTTNYPILTSLLAGTNSSYVSSSSSGGAKIPSVSSPPSSPVAGQLWFNASGNSFQYYNGTSVQTIGTSGAGISSLTVGSNLTAGGSAGGTLTGPGTIDIVNSGVSSGTYPKVTVNAKGFVTYGTGLSESDIPTLSTAGHIVGSAIVSGTIGGTTNFYSSGNVSVPTVTSGQSLTRQIQLFDPASGSTHKITILAPTLSADYSLIFPATAGSAGYALTTDGSGNLSWSSSAAGSVTSVGLSLPSIFSVTTPIVTSSGTLTATLANQNANLIFAGPSTGSASAPTFRALTVNDIPTSYDSTVLKTSLASGKIWVGNSGGVATAVTPSGDLSLANSGLFTVSALQGYAVSAIAPTTSGQVLRWNGSAWTPNSLAMSDLRSTVTGTSSLASCSASQTLVFNSVTDSLLCSNINIASSQVSWGSTGANLVFAGPSTGGSASPTFRSLTAADLPSGIYDQTYFKQGGNSFGASAVLGTNDSNQLTLATSGLARLSITSSGNIGVGVASPTSRLMLAAGSATAGTSPLKLTSGTVLGAPEPGAVEFDGISLYYTDSGSVRHALAASGSGISQLSGDVTASGNGSASSVVNRVNGVTYPASPSVNTVPVVTSAGTVSYVQIPNAALANNSTTLGSTVLTLGGTANTVSGLTSLGLGINGTATGVLTLANGSSGGATTLIEANPGTTTAWNLTLPASAGSAGTFLQTNGSGLTTWASPAGSGTVTSGITNQLAIFATGGTTVSGLTSANSSVLLTNPSGVPAWNLSSNDNFSQYALLNGRAGGQIWYGGTGASENVTISSTSNATKGFVLLQPNGGNVGIGTASPGGILDIWGSAGDVNFPSTGNTISFGKNGANYIAANTGGSSSLALQTNGATRLYLDPSGNVGVGTTSPQALLDLYGTGTVSAMLVPRDSTTNRPVTGINGMLRYNTVSNAMETFANGTWNSIATSASGGGASQWTTSGSNIYYGSGNVGIGTSLPSESLDAYGAIIVRGQVSTLVPSIGALDYSSGNTRIVSRGPDASTNGGFKLALTRSDGSNPMIPLVVSSSGNVGIGTNAPSSLLQVGNFPGTSRASGIQLGNTYSSYLYTNSSNNQLVLDSNGDTDFRQNAGTNNGSGIIAFQTGLGTSVGGTGVSTEKMRINGFGQVGIGTNSPLSNLDIFGPNALQSLRSTSTAGFSAINFYDPSTANQASVGWGNSTSGLSNQMYLGTTSAFPITFRSNGLERVRIDSFGNLGINTINPQAILDINGLGTGQSAMLIPRDSTLNRPAGVNGMLRYNTASGKLEAFASSAWQTLDTSSGTSGAFVNGGNAFGTSATLGTTDLNSLALLTNNAPRVTITSSGNVGIGTAIPGNQLEVVTTYTKSAASGTYPFALSSSDSTNPLQLTFALSPSSTAANRYASITAVEQGVGYRNLVLQPNSGNVGIGAQPLSTLDVNGGISAGSYAGISAAPANGIIVSGSVGVGTTLPISTLNINVAGSANADMFVVGNISTKGLVIKDTGSDLDLYTVGHPLWMNAGGQNTFMNPYGGNVGVGTTSPQALLDVYGTGTTSAMIVPRASSANRPTGVAGMIRYNTDNAALEMYNGTIWSNLTTAAGGSGFYLPLAGGSLTGVVAHPLGSATAPSINFGDAATGLYSTGSGNVSFAVNGTSRVSISSAGNLGINSAVPPLGLSLSGAGYASNSAAIDLNNTGTGGQDWRIFATDSSFGQGAGKLLFYNQTSAINALTISSTGNIGVGTSSPTSLFHLYSSTGLQALIQNGGDAGTAKLSFKNSIGTTNIGRAVTVGGSSGSAFEVADGSSSRLYIDQAGNAGIGTTSPQAILDIYGTGTTSAIIVPRASSANRPTGVAGMIRYNTDNSVLEMFNGSVWTNLSTAASGASQWTTSGSSIFYGSGSVGVGTNAPQATLSIYSSGGDIDLSPDSLSANLYLNYPGQSTYVNLRHSSGSFQVYNGSVGATLAIKDSNGFVGIGTSFPNRNLVVYGSGPSFGIYDSNASGSNLALNPPAASAGSVAQIDVGGSNDIRINTNSAERMRILGTNGNVGIGTTAPNAALEIAGNLRKTWINTNGTSGNTSTYWQIAANDGSANWSELLNSNGTTSPTAVSEGAGFRRAYTPGLVAGTNIYYQQYAAPALVGSSQAWKSYLEVDAKNNYLDLMSSGGSVGIGTTTPQEALSVLTSGSTIPAFIRAGSGAATFARNLYYNGTNWIFNSASDGSLLRLDSSGMSVQMAGTGAAGGTASLTIPLTVLAGGNVGVGTTSPQAILDVYGTGTTSAMIVPRATTANRPATGVAGMLRYNTDNSALEMYNGSIWTNLTTAAGGSSYLPLSGGTLTGVVAHPLGSVSAPSINFGDTSSGLYSTGSGNISIATGSTNRLTVNSSGFVGIGTSVPGGLFDIATNGGGGAFYLRDISGTAGTLRMINSAGGNYIQSGLSTNAGSSAPLYFTSMNAANSWMMISSGGNVGVATLNPQSILQVGNVSTASWSGVGIGPAYYNGASSVYNTGFIGTNLVGGGNSYATGTDTGNNGATAILSNIFGSIQFATVPSTGGVQQTLTGSNLQNDIRMTINSLGNVGIATTSPQAILDVNGTGTSQSAILIPRDSSGNRPSGINGMLRYNTTTNKLEAYEGSSWTSYANTTGANQWNSGASSSVNYTAGNIGIGTISPIAPLNIYGTASTPTLSSSNTSNPSGALFAVESNGANGLSVGVYGSGGSYGTWLQSSFMGSGAAVAYPLTINALGGNVGIGTTSPAALLDISGSGSNSAIIVPRATIAQRPTSAVNGMIRYQLDNNTLETYANGSWTSLATTTLTGAYLPLVGGTMTGAVAHANGTVTAPGISFANSATTGLYSTGAGTMSIATAGIARMAFDSSGNIGIGSASPGATLDVAGSFKATGTWTGPNLMSAASFAGGTWIDLPTSGPSAIGSSGAGNNAWIGFVAANDQWITGAVPGDIAYRNTTGRLLFATSATGGASLAMSGSNVGVGLMAPNRALEINSSGSYQMRIGNGVASSANTYDIGRDTTTGFLSFYGNQTGNSGYNFAGINGTYLTIKNSGNVGIGTSTPGSLLDVYGLGSQSAMLVPRDSSASRPTGVNGMLRYNTTNAALETYANNTWITLGASAVGTFLPLAGGTMNGAIVGFNGSASAPAHSFADTSTGLYSTGAGNISMTTSGTSRLSINSNGYLGIGTSSPLSLFHVRSSSGTSASMYLDRSNDNDQININFRSAASYSSSTPFWTLGQPGSTYDFRLYNYNGTTTNYAFTVKPDGSVGIGTTSPGATLDVKGHVANSGATATIGSCGTSPAITGNDVKGHITIGTGSPTTCTITFNAAYSITPECVVTALATDPGTIRWWLVPSSTALVINFSATPTTTNQQFSYHCMQ